MSKKDKFFSYFFLVLAIVDILGNLFVLLQKYEILMPKVIAVLSLAAICFALYYTLKGHSKNVALSYKLFMVSCFVLFQACACANGMTLGAYEIKAATGISIAVNCLIAAIFFCLAFANDLGKRRTYRMLILAQLLTLCGVVTVLYYQPGLIFGGTLTGTTFVVRASTKFLLVCVACMLAIFKYQDKESRGTK